MSDQFTQQIRRFLSPMRIASAVYFVLGLACLGNIHDATLMGIGYLMLSACYLQGYGQK
jgi:hypothetical protein